jgi:hypothetical protein
MTSDDPWDLTVVGSPAGGGGLGDVDLIYVREAVAFVLAIVGLVSLLAARRLLTNCGSGGALIPCRRVMPMGVLGMFTSHPSAVAPIGTGGCMRMTSSEIFKPMFDRDVPGWLA